MKNFLRRTVFVAASLLLAAQPGLRAQLTAANAHATSLEDRRKALEGVFHDYWQDVMEHNPEYASEIGDKRFNDKVSDYSVQAVNDSLERGQTYLMRLAAIDPAGFTEQEKTSRDLLLRRLADDQEASEFKEWEMPVNQMDGIYDTYPQLVTELSFNSAKDYDDWIARLHAMPNAFSQVIANMSIGMDDHRVPPKYLLEKVLDQVQAIAAEKPEDTPFALPLKKFPASVPPAEQERIKTEMLAAIQKEVLPAYTHFARFLKASYVPAGRTDPGIWALSDGAKYYQFLIHQSTTTNLSADQIHQLGLEEVKKDEAAMLEIAQKLGFKDLASFRASLKANPKLKATSGDQLLAAYRGYLGPMKAKLPDYFGHLPKAPFEAVPMPDFLAKTAPPAYYQAGTPDGSRPGRLLINLDNATSRNLYSIEAVAYHEGIPGHHLQISIAQEQTGVPEFRKHNEYTAFVEGWALYSEHLGKDIGFYQDPYSDYGRLEADMWRAIRLVIDTGVHSQHWTREQMVQYFHDHSNIDEPTVQSEVDRYIAWPGQALAYKIGQLEILKLRAAAQKELGDKFKLSAFHDAVLDSGPLPMDVLEQRINGWIATQKAGTAR